MGFFESLNYLDVNLFWRINAANAPVLDSFFAVFTYLGSGWVAAPVVIVIVALGMPRKALVHALVFIALSMTASGVVNSQIKFLVKRPRPLTYFAERREEAIFRGDKNLSDKPGPWSLIPRVVGPRWKHRSFPSGHANTAFSAAMILFLLLGGWWVLAYPVAFAVAYSRVYLGVHFPFDTVGGAFVGAIVVELAFLAYCKWVFPFQRQKPEPRADYCSTARR